MLEMPVQAVIAAIEEALVADRPSERVGANTLIADMADLDALTFVHGSSPYARGMLVFDMETKAQAFEQKPALWNFSPSTQLKITESQNKKTLSQASAAHFMRLRWSSGKTAGLRHTRPIIVSSFVKEQPY